MQYILGDYHTMQLYFDLQIAVIEVFFWLLWNMVLYSAGLSLCITKLYGVLWQSDFGQTFTW